MDKSCEDMTPEEWMRYGGRGMVWRITLSIAAALGWLAFLILWLGFYAGDYNVYQNIAVIIASIIGLVAVNAIAWASFGLRMARKEGTWHPRGADIVTGIAGVAWAVFLVVWLMLYAGDYSVYQNLAVFIVSILAFGGISGAAHAIGWARNPQRY